MCVGVRVGEREKKTKWRVYFCFCEFGCDRERVRVSIRRSVGVYVCDNVTVRMYGCEFLCVCVKMSVCVCASVGKRH